MRTVTFKIDEKMLEELDRVCAELGIRRSDAIREGIKEFLKSNTKKLSGSTIKIKDKVVVR